MHKPWHTMLFAGFLFGILGILSLLVPANGSWSLSGIEIVYPRPGQLFEVKEKKNIDQILSAMEDEGDSTFILADSTPAVTATKAPVATLPPKLIQTIQYKEHDALDE